MRWDENGGCFIQLPNPTSANAVCCADSVDEFVWIIPQIFHNGTIRPK